MSAVSAHPMPSGRHILAELTECATEMLDQPAALEACFRHCAVAGGATLVSSHFHQFSPQGVSGVVVIAESHITVHTWPELNYAAVDVFTCGKPEIAENVMSLLVSALQAGLVKKTSFARGPLESPKSVIGNL